MDFNKFKLNGSQRGGGKSQHISLYSAMDAGDSIHSNMNPDQYLTSKLMMANEHITLEAFNSLIPKESKFEAN